ncbi:hypothetical protein DFJ74DRAFT_672580 [Hyaloraphidium curvatum]|nr:hypothetical protein DFJ74DRAFT_672580 [Hyaloraphidium curvatum]
MRTTRSQNIHSTKPEQQVRHGQAWSPSACSSKVEPVSVARAQFRAPVRHPANRSAVGGRKERRASQFATWISIAATQKADTPATDAATLRYGNVPSLTLKASVAAATKASEVTAPRMASVCACASFRLLQARTSFTIPARFGDSGSSAETRASAVGGASAGSLDSGVGPARASGNVSGPVGARTGKSAASSAGARVNGFGGCSSITRGSRGRRWRVSFLPAPIPVRSIAGSP